MVGIPSFISRGTSGAKAAPPTRETPPANGSKPGEPANGQPYKPGQDSPDDIAGNQVPPKKTMGDKLGMAANVAMAGSMVIPMLPMGGDKQKEGQPPPGQNPEGPHIEDPTGYKQNQVKTAVGPTPINW